jgi:hypothetical protein
MWKFYWIEGGIVSKFCKKELGNCVGILLTERWKMCWNFKRIPPKGR